MIQVFDCQQNSEEWRRLRCGIPTSSEFAAILAKGEGKTRKAYMLRLAGEILTGEPGETYENADMIRGREMEPEARSMYAFMRDAEPVQVGFVRNQLAGCSPDSFLGDDGILEIKTKKPSVLIECILRGTFPPEHKAQCQGALWVTGRKYVDIACYWPSMPLFICRAEREDGYIATLAGAVKQFNEELASIVEHVRAYRGSHSADPAPLLAAG